MKNTLFDEAPYHLQRAYEKRINENIGKHKMLRPEAVQEARVWLREEIERDKLRQQSHAAQLPLFEGGGYCRKNGVKGEATITPA